MRYYANKSPRSKGVLSGMYFTAEEAREITKDAGDIGYLLMTFYVGIGHQTNPNMEDAHLAKMIGKAPSTVRDARLKLTKAGWFKRTAVSHQGEKHFMYAVGKQAVHDSSKGNIAILSQKKLKQPT